MLVNLFRPPLGAPLRPDAINELVDGLCARAGIARRLTPHMARHAFASNVDAGGGLDDVQVLLGHSSPSSSQRYVHQRHADAGVPVDVLCDLMDHKELTTRQGYYRVGEQRRREATDRVTTMQFDRHGNRVWRHATSLLDSERARRAIGEVAVPYGVCTEPSNVAVGGQDCPVRFRCVGCGHFRTDVSYLPNLEAYLADLLRTRERLLTGIDADEWATAEAMPSEEEIRRVRTLIARVKTDLDQLDDQEQAHIQQAVATVRRARNGIVGLGLPRTRQPLPGIRPESTR